MAGVKGRVGISSLDERYYESAMGNQCVVH